MVAKKFRYMQFVTFSWFCAHLMLWWMINKVVVVKDKEPFLLGCNDATQIKRKPFKDFKTFRCNNFMVYLKTKNCLCLKINNPSLMIYMDSSWTGYLTFHIYGYQVGITKISFTNWSPTSIIFNKQIDIRQQLPKMENLGYYIPYMLHIGKF